MNTRRWILALCLAAGTASGCIRSVNTVERAQPVARPQVVADKRIETDLTLSEKAHVVGVHETVVGDLVKIQVDVMSTHSDQHQFNYKFEWFDDAGMIVDSPMSVWKSQTIRGGETVSLVSVAPNPKAKDFRLKMQESKRDL